MADFGRVLETPKTERALLMTASSFTAGPWRTFERARRRMYQTRAMQRARRGLRIASPAIMRPIFLVGTVRSGTTFLARCIGDHPAVMLTGFELLREWSDYAGVEIAAPGLDHANCTAADGRTLTDDQVATIRQRFDALHVRKGGWKHTRFMNKNPHLWNKLDLVDRLYPDAYYVVTSRDLFSTVASTKLLWDKMHRDWGLRYFLPHDPSACWSCSPPLDKHDLDPARTFPGGDVAVLAEYWLRTYETIEKKLAGRPRVVTLRHAQFVVEPRETLETVLSALDLPVLPHHLPEPVKRRRNQRWREILTRDEIDRLGEACTQLAPRIGKLTLAEVAVPTESTALSEDCSTGDAAS